MPSLRLDIKADDDASRILEKVAATLRKAGNQGEKFGDKVKKGSKKADDSLTKTKNKAKAVQGAFSKLGGALKAVFAGAAAFATIRFLTQSLKLLSVQEQAVNNLALAMRNLGVFSQRALKDQTEFAASLQKVTVFGDEAIIGLQALLTGFGLYGEELKTTTKATLDLSTFLGVDLKAAAILLGKAFVGEVSALSRYGLLIDASIPSSEKFAAVTALINKQFGGAAQEQTRTYAGKIQQLGNQFGDLQETIGKELLPIAESWINIIRRTIEATGAFTTTTEDSLSVDELSIKRNKEKILGLKLLLKNTNDMTASAMRRRDEIVQEIKTTGRIIGETRKRIAVDKAAEDSAAATGAARIKAIKQEEAAAKELAATAKDRAKAEQDFNAFLIELQAERAELAGQELEADILRVEQKRDAELLSIRELRAEELISKEQLKLGEIELEEVTSKRLAKMRQESSETFKAVATVTGAVASSIESQFSDTFTKMILEGKTFSEQMKFFFQDLARVAIAEITRILVKMALLKLAGGIGGPFGAAVVAGISGEHGISRVPGPVGTPVPIIAHGGERIVPAGGNVPAGGGGGGVTNIFNVNLRVATLDASDRRQVIEALTEEMRQATDPARQLASEQALLAERNEGLAT